MDVGTSQPDDEYEGSGLLYLPNPGLWSVQGFPVNHRFPPEQLLRIANPCFCLNHVRSRWESEVTGAVPNGLGTELAHMAAPACVNARGSSLPPRGFRVKRAVREPVVGPVRRNVDALWDDVAVLFPVAPRPDALCTLQCLPLPRRCGVSDPGPACPHISLRHERRHCLLTDLMHEGVRNSL